MLKNFADTSNPTLDSHPTTPNFDVEPIKIGLVLTGGGSHGAYGAGVLEAILPTLNELGTISLITGTSAGAVNAVAAGSGLNASGPNEAIYRLKETWEIVKNHNNLLSRKFRFFSDAFLPEDQRWPNFPTLPFNPASMIQPFMPSLTAQFISATARGVVKNWEAEVQKGPVKIAVNTILESRHKWGAFEHVILSGTHLTPDGVGASANLKQLGFHMINDSQNPDLAGRRTYDGAYKENGPLEPHLNERITDCIMIILHDRRHNELDKIGALKHAEIHINALDLARQDSHSPIRLHGIEIESLGGEIGGLAHIADSSKLNTDSEFINMLYQAGLKAGHQWLKNNSLYIGQMSSYSFYQPALNQLAEMGFS